MKRLARTFLILAVCFSLVGMVGCGEQPTLPEGGISPPSGEESSPPLEEEPTSSEVSQTTEVKVLEDSIFISPGHWEGEIMYSPEIMYGEIQNTGDTWACVTEMRVEFYDSRGWLREPRATRVISHLFPGQKSPFRVVSFVPYSEYTFKIEYKAASFPSTYRIEAEILNIKRNPEDRCFEVEIHNKRNESLGFEVYISSVATYYDNQGRVIGYASGHEAGVDEVFSDYLFPFLPNQVKTYIIDWPSSAFADYDIQVC